MRRVRCIPLMYMRQMGGCAVRGSFPFSVIASPSMLSYVEELATKRDRALLVFVCTRLLGLRTLYNTANPCLMGGEVILEYIVV